MPDTATRQRLSFSQRREITVVVSVDYESHESPGRGLSTYSARFRVRGRKMEAIPFAEGGLLP